MALTDAQLQTLATGLRASADSTVTTALALRDDYTLTQWCNTEGSTDAWNPMMVSKDLFEATDVTKFDNLTAGKRDAWRLLLTYAPIDMARNKMRKAVEDTWGATDSVAVLQACVRKATNGEAILGGTSATTNTVTALKLNVVGPLMINDISQALNRF